MMMLVGIAEMIVWFVISFFIIGYGFKVVKKRGWANEAKSHFIVKFILFVILAMFPIWSLMLYHQYQLFTFPMVCKAMGGYQPYNPVKVTSILNESTGLYNLVLPNTKFTEWEKSEADLRYSSDWVTGFEIGKYRFSYFPKESQECYDLLDRDPSLEDHLEEIKGIYQKNGYPLKKTTDQCVGMQKISKFEYEYEIQREPVNNKINSGFGYEIDVEVTQLFNRQTGKVISKFQDITTSSPTPFFSLFSDLRLIKSCWPYEDLNRAHNTKLNQNIQLSRRAIELGFFDFSNE